MSIFLVCGKVLSPQILFAAAFGFICAFAKVIGDEKPDANCSTSRYLSIGLESIGENIHGSFRDGTSKLVFNFSHPRCHPEKVNVSPGL